MKIDRRKNYYLTIDTETCGDIKEQNMLAYDIGGAIHDKQGNIYETFSFVIYDIFVLEVQRMVTCYYADKLGIYTNDLKNGTRKMVSLEYARNYINKLCKQYNVKAICAYNARFDWITLKNTSKHTVGKNYFYPYGIELWDTWKMAKDTICKQKNYERFCIENNFLTKHKKPQLKTSAEVVYSYMVNDPDYKESHTGLEDVMIEIEIFSKCMRQHKKMRRLLFERK